MLTQLSTPVKAASDPASYRAIRLENGLVVLLIHDENTDKAAASLDVRVGSMADPETHPGLAHFLEHLLFMGTSKYPNEAEYAAFLSEHAGSSNAYTDHEDTNYFFDVGVEHLYQALDRFSQFFVAPLFDPSCTDREREAVHSEFEKNLLEDNWRIDQILRSLTNPSHPFHKFGIGNRETLSSTTIRKDSLDTMQTWVADMFSQMPVRKSLPQSYLETPPVLPEHLGRVAWIDTIKDMRLLEISWFVPDQIENFRSKPFDVISHVAGHEGPGSLLCYLREAGLATELSAGLAEHVLGFDIFQVSVTLSKQGLCEWSKVLWTIFFFFNFLRSTDLDRITDECIKLSNLHFEFQDRKESAAMVERLSRNLQHYATEDILKGPLVLESCSSALLASSLEGLVPQRALVIMACRNGEKDNGLSHASGDGSSEEDEGEDFSSDDEEDEEHQESLSECIIPESRLGKGEVCQWFGTRFATQRLPEVPEIDAVFELPAPNIFIPQNLEVLGRREKEPGLPMQFGSWKWWKLDDTFLLPKTIVCVCFETENEMDAAVRVGLKLWLDVVGEDLDELLYPAALVGISYEVTSRPAGIQIWISGFTDCISRVLDIILETLSKPTARHFGRAKDRLLRRLADEAHEAPWIQAASLALLLIRENSHGAQQLHSALGGIDSLPAPFLKTFHGSVACLVVGNIADDSAKAVCNLPFAPGVVVPRILRLETGVLAIYRSVPHPASAAVVYHQIGAVGTEEHAYALLTVQVLSEQFFDELRTREQLGYIVRMRLRVDGKICGIESVVQSIRGPGFLWKRIERFFEDFVERGIGSEFGRHTKALQALLTERPTRLKRETEKYWAAVLRGDCMMDLETRLATLVGNLTADGLLRFVSNAIVSTETRRVAVLASYGETAPQDELLMECFDGSKDDDIAALKHRLVYV